MKMQVNDLTGAALDYAVAVILKEDYTYLRSREACRGTKNYSTDWGQGGPIIEREWICADRLMNGSWWACKRTNEGDAYLHQASGRTPLIAAMRCYVASKLGDTVEIPDCLLNGAGNAQE